MALIGELTEAELGGLTGRVASRMGSETTALTPPAGSTLMEIAGAAVQFIVDIAPKCPAAIGREAMIRLGAHLLGNRPYLSEHVVKDPSGTEYTLRFANHAATSNSFRHSGASALVSKYVQRRAGPVG